MQILDLIKESTKLLQISYKENEDISEVVSRANSLDKRINEMVNGRRQSLALLKFQMRQKKLMRGESQHKNKNVYGHNPKLHGIEKVLAFLNKRLNMTD